MKQYFSFLLFTVLVVSLKAQPPNNPIFAGGIGDGISNASWLIASVNIFSGGAGDGESVVTNSVLPNPIYAGGQGDGFSFNANNAVPNNIFSGGGGDGWSAIVLPLGPLPVELLSFSAEHSGEAHLVKWSTAAELNTMQFEVQRSTDARLFRTIGTVAASGSNSTGSSYRFRVNDPWNGNNFYRLKINDNDGSVTYSNIVLLVNSMETNWSVYPNPTAEMIYISFPEIRDEDNFPAAIFDAAGKLLKRFSIYPSRRNAVDVASLPAGVYYLRFMIKNQPKSIRFVKSN